MGEWWWMVRWMVDGRRVVGADHYWGPAPTKTVVAAGIMGGWVRGATYGGSNGEGKKQKENRRESDGEKDQGMGGDGKGRESKGKRKDGRFGRDG